MSSIVSSAARPGDAGATTRTSTPASRSPTASRSRNEPAESPAWRGYEWARKRTRIRRAAPARALRRAVGRSALRALVRGRRQPLRIELPTELAELGTLHGDLLA